MEEIEVLALELPVLSAPSVLFTQLEVAVQ
jgi:hypothetical protein